MTTNTDDLRIRKTDELISPEQLIADQGVSDTAAHTVANARSTIHRILTGEDDRLLAPPAMGVGVLKRILGHQRSFIFQFCRNRLVGIKNKLTVEIFNIVRKTALIVNRRINLQPVGQTDSQRQADSGDQPVLHQEVPQDREPRRAQRPPGTDLTSTLRDGKREGGCR